MRQLRVLFFCLRAEEMRSCETYFGKFEGGRDGRYNKRLNRIEEHLQRTTDFKRMP